MNDKNTDISPNPSSPSLSEQGPHIGKERTGMAGGIFIAFFPILGAVIGGLMGQPSAGLLIGLALGILAALAIWLLDRKKGSQ